MDVYPNRILSNNYFARVGAPYTYMSHMEMATVTLRKRLGNHRYHDSIHKHCMTTMSLEKGRIQQCIRPKLDHILRLSTRVQLFL